MDQQPSSTRPSVVTTVAVLLFIRGGLSMGGFIALAGGSFLGGSAGRECSDLFA